MYSNNQRKPYRVAQKQIEQTNGLFIPSQKKQQYLIFTIAILLLVLVKGILIGLLLSKRR